MAIHIEIGDEVVIVEGTATELVAPGPPLARRDPGRLRQVQGGRGLRSEPDHWTQGGLWELRPVKAFAWSAFPTT